MKKGRINFMKKLQYVLITLTIAFLGIMFGIMFNFAPEYTYNLSQDSAPEASKILYEYILQDEDMTDEMLEFAHIYPESARAFEYDLNDDGENEIIGVVYSTFYWGTAGYSLFILQKQNNLYEEITWIVNFEPLLPIRILKEKSNGYKNVGIYGSSAFNFKPLLVKYENGKYQQKATFKKLLDALKQ